MCYLQPISPLEGGQHAMFSNFPQFHKIIKAVETFNFLFLKMLHYSMKVTWAKYERIQNFTTDAQFSVISDISS